MSFIITFILADINYAKGQTYYQEGQFINAMIYYSNAYKLQKIHLYEDRLSSVYANLAIIAPYQKSLNTKPQQFIELSRLLSQDSLAQSPQNVQYWKTKGKEEYLYYQATLDKNYLMESTNSLAHARSLAPTDPRIPYTESLIYSLYADELQKNPQEQLRATQESLSLIQESINLKPDYSEAYILQAQLLKKAGDADKAQKVREYILKQFPQITPKQLEDEL
jgi:tetratricopeptide (TPR) repeat protein